MSRRSHRRPRVHRLAPPVVWAVLLVGASVMHPSQAALSPSLTPIPLDVLFHVLGYATLAALLVRADVPLLRAIFACALLGAGVECVQGPLPYRNRSALDGIANGVGAVIGGFVARKFQQIWARRRH